jgi:hypothetical protein
MTEHTKETMAALMTGREYGSEITREEARAAEAAGLVVVYGASDDLMEFEGAIHDEIGAYNGTTALVDCEGILDRDRIDDDDDDEIAEYVRRKKTARKIKALWCESDGLAWTFRTDIPHATFVILDDGEPWCRGIVFSLADLT